MLLSHHLPLFRLSLFFQVSPVSRHHFLSRVPGVVGYSCLLCLTDIIHILPSKVIFGEFHLLHCLQSNPHGKRIPALQEYPCQQGRGRETEKSEPFSSTLLEYPWFYLVAKGRQCLLKRPRPNLTLPTPTPTPNTTASSSVTTSTALLPHGRHHGRPPVTAFYSKI